MSAKIPLILSAALAVGVALAAPAFASESVDDETKAKVVEKLEAMGYEVRKVEREDGELEAYALKDGHRFEIYLDENLNIVREKED